MTKISCLGCGASLALQSPATVFVICKYCNSALLRNQDWQNYGKIARLPPEVTLLQIGSKGSFNGESFEVIGRQKLRWAEGYWTEWYALFANGKTGWIAEAQGLLMMSFPCDLPPEAKDASFYKVGTNLAVEKTIFKVDDIKKAERIGSEGELPFAALAQKDLVSIDASNPSGQFLSVEIPDDATGIRAYSGRYVNFKDLMLQNLRDLRAEEEFAPTDSAVTSQMHSFQCTQCGSPIPVRTPGQSMTFACVSCGAIAQEDNAGVRILIQESQSSLYKPLFELGSKATFRGHIWQVLGFMVRSDVEETFYWREYLLFNPSEGYRFLMEADGHWNFMFLTKHIPTGYGTDVKWGGRRYKRFHVGQAKVQFVLGEFYWRVKVGDTVSVADYVAAPDILSCEEDGSEKMWTAGKYIPAEDIQKAFKLLGTLPKPYGVAPNQPSKFVKQRNNLLLHWLGFVALILVIHVIRTSTTTTKVFDQRLQRNMNPVMDLVKSESFEIPKDNSNLEVSLKAPMKNSWLGLTGRIVPDEGQAPVILFQRQLVSYDSAEEGGNIRENAVDLFFPKVSKGSYHFEFSLERDPAQPVQSTYYGDDDKLIVSAVVDPPLAGNLIFSLILITLYPLIYLLRDMSFENNRWSQSNRVDRGNG